MTASPPLFSDQTRQAAETLAIAAVGAGLFVLLRVPAGAILGSLLFTAGAALAGRRLRFPGRVRDVLFFATGIGAGSGVTPEALRAAQAWPLSVAALIVTSAIIWLVGAQLFRRLSGSDPRTAALATAPGALSAVMVLADEQGADAVKIAVAQTLRIAILVSIAPLALGLGHAPLPIASTQGLLAPELAWPLLIAAGLVGWLGAHRLGWSVPVFFGALVGSAVLHATGLVGERLPPTLVQVMTAGLGGVIGVRFSGLRPRDLVAVLPASFITLAAMAAIAAPVGALVGWWAGVGALPGLLAFAPGSLEMMIAVSLSLNAEPAYVAAHHVVRTLLLLAGLPLLGARWKRRDARAKR